MSLEARVCKISARIASSNLIEMKGILTGIREEILTATLSDANRGAICAIERTGSDPLCGKVLTVSGDTVSITPFEQPFDLVTGARVTQLSDCLKLPVGNGLLGRVVDAFLRPIDELGPILGVSTDVAFNRTVGSVMSRPLITEPFETGVRAVDGLATLGVGQRIGIFGTPGSGKTSLMGMLARHCKADVVVVGLVGERGREVREFIEDVLPAAMRNDVVVVTATSDRPAVERAMCSESATCVAEFFRDQGKSVLLLIDSLTRTARALREIGLAIGEPPTRRGYPASVYPALPSIIERSGRSIEGDITAIYTVLTEGAIESDPIAEEVKSLTDGHIVLSSELASAGHYPAIDVLSSLSRSMNKVVSKEHLKASHSIRSQLTKYKEIEVLLQVGEYHSGSDPEADLAISNRSQVNSFLRQDTDDSNHLKATVSKLLTLAK